VAIYKSEYFGGDWMKIALTLIGWLYTTISLAIQPSVNFDIVPTFSLSGQLQMVVEIPAGTSRKNEYSRILNSFPADVKEGKDRIIDFLPYPGNYGFIPSTLMERSKGGDGDALDVLVLSQHNEVGSVLAIIPIAILNLVDNGELDSKIIAVPYNADHQIISATSYGELVQDYPNIKRIVELWFTSYKGADVVEFINWEDESHALTSITKWLVKS
jgi:inorganic pyrophosphatase